MGHEKHGVTVFGEGLRALSARMLPRSTEQGEARKRLPAGIPVPITHHRHRSPVWTGARRYTVAPPARAPLWAGPQPVHGLTPRILAAAHLATGVAQTDDRERTVAVANPGA